VIVAEDVRESRQRPIVLEQPALKNLLRGSPWSSHVLRVKIYAKPAHKHRCSPQTPEPAPIPTNAIAEPRSVSSPES